MKILVLLLYIYIHKIIYIYIYIYIMLTLREVLLCLEKTSVTKLRTIRPFQTFWMCCNSATDFGTSDSVNHRISFSVVDLFSNCLMVWERMDSWISRVDAAIITIIIFLFSFCTLVSKDPEGWKLRLKTSLEWLIFDIRLWIESVTESNQIKPLHKYRKSLE